MLVDGFSLVGASVTLMAGWCFSKLGGGDGGGSDGNNKGNSKTGKDGATTSNNSVPKTMPQELREEQLSRHTLYFGDDGIGSIKASKVTPL